MKGLAQTVLTWEGKVFAVADAAGDADADAAEADWKHKVTPDRGDLNIKISLQCYFCYFTKADDCVCFMSTIFIS